MKIKLTVNGLQVEAHYHDDEIENVHKPLLQQLAKYTLLIRSDVR